MRPKPDKKYLLVNSIDGKYPLKISNKTITNSKGKKTLGNEIDQELNFKEYKQAQKLVKK